MGPRVKRVSVRAYNLRPGDEWVNSRMTVESANVYPGMWKVAFMDIRFTNGTQINGFDPDATITILRSYA